VKNILLVDRDLFIRFLGKTHPGRVHDKKAADESPYPLPKNSHLLQDLGFLGFKLEGVEIEMPIKKPRGGELTDEQRAINRALARRRVAIEHVNSGVKRCRMLKDVCRLLRDGIRDLIMEVGCALHNFRLRFRPWLPIPEPG
jgi:DDE superfamily endonuclease